MRDFRDYLGQLGFPTSSGTVSVDIRPGKEFDVQGTNWIAVWQPETNSIIVASAFANDKAMVLRQLAHPILSIRPIRIPQDVAIESGLATYFPCSYLNDPMLGNKISGIGKSEFAEDLTKMRPFSEIQSEQRASVQNDGSEIWGGAFWQVRQLLGKERADRLIAQTWLAFSPENQKDIYAAFVGALLRNSEASDGGMYIPQLKAIFEKRGLQL